MFAFKLLVKMLLLKFITNSKVPIDILKNSLNNITNQTQLSGMLGETTAKSFKSTEIIQKNDTNLLVTKLYNTIQPTMKQVGYNLSDLKGNEENQEMIVETTEITIKSTENINNNEEILSGTVNIINNNNKNFIITTASVNATNQEESEGNFEKSSEFWVNMLQNTSVSSPEGTTQFLKEDPLEVTEKPPIVEITQVRTNVTNNNLDIFTTTITTTTIQNINMGYDILKSHSNICGYFLGKRISFANKTTLMQYPWSALLVYNTTERFHCGGSLITSKYVLTAAHCVNQYFYPLVAVRIGEHNISSIIDCDLSLTYEKICAEQVIDAGIEEIIIHNEFNRLTLKNDIAMVRLTQVIQYTRSHYPICLPEINEDLRTYEATITGWGATEKSLRSDVLLEADIPVLNISMCQKIYRSRRFDDDREICASGVNEVDVCKGDSGGPLFTRKLRGRKIRIVQLGITSLGVATCGDNRYLPALFTRVSYYISWIAQNLKT